MYKLSYTSRRRRRHPYIECRAGDGWRLRTGSQAASHERDEENPFTVGARRSGVEGELQNPVSLTLLLLAQKRGECKKHRTTQSIARFATEIGGRKLLCVGNRVGGVAVSGSPAARTRTVKVIRFNDKDKIINGLIFPIDTKEWLPSEPVSQPTRGEEEREAGPPIAIIGYNRRRPLAGRLSHHSSRTNN